MLRDLNARYGAKFVLNICYTAADDTQFPTPGDFTLCPCLTISKRVEATMSPKKVGSLLQNACPSADVASPATTQEPTS